MNNNFRPLCEDEVKSKKSEVLNKLNIFLKKHKPDALKEISERKKQLREKAIKAFGDIQIDKLISDQSILLHNKQKEFLMENKSEILNLLEFIEKVNEGVLNKDEVEKHMFDMTNVNTKFENIWFNTTKFMKIFTCPVAMISAWAGFLGAYKFGSDNFGSQSGLTEFGVYLGMFGGGAIGAFSLHMIHDFSKITKRANEIKSLNETFEKAYIYHDDYCKKMFE